MDTQTLIQINKRTETKKEAQKFSLSLSLSLSSLMYPHKHTILSAALERERSPGTANMPPHSYPTKKQRC